jgi:hypothetical protein
VSCVTTASRFIIAETSVGHRWFKVGNAFKSISSLRLALKFEVKCVIGYATPTRHVARSFGSITLTNVTSKYLALPG